MTRGFTVAQLSLLRSWEAYRFSLESVRKYMAARFGVTGLEGLTDGNCAIGLLDLKERRKRLLRRRMVNSPHVTDLFEVTVGSV